MPTDPTALHRFATILADTLVPGEGEFPSASAAGVVSTFEKRLVELRGEGHLSTISDHLLVPGSFCDLKEQQRIDAVAALERNHHALFEEMLAILYLSYYESPIVTAAIQAAGFVYHNPPQPHGYEMTAFNEADALEYPRHGRGRYVRTEDVRRVSFAGLDHLADPIDSPR